MRVTAIVEKDGGIFEFSAELTAEQHRFLLEYAIQSLVHRGLVPFNVTTDDDGVSIGVAETMEPSKGH